MTGNENIRINKVLKEFNIGIGTLTDFLKKKGIEIEGPNGKISGDCYDMVSKEFGKEQMIKEQSKKVAIKVKEITKIENNDHEDDYDDHNDVVLIKTNTVSAEPIVAPKEVKSEVVNSAPKTVEVEVVKETPTPIQKESTPQSNDVKPSFKEEKNNIPSTVKTTPKKDEVKKEEHKKDNSLKIVGKIDLNQRKKEKVQNHNNNQNIKNNNNNNLVNNKKQEQTLNPKNNTKNNTFEKKVEDAAPIQKREEVEHITTRVEKLTGPVISGTIDLSKFEKKPSANKSNNNNNKGKRERIHKNNNRVDINKPVVKKANGEQKPGDNKNSQDNRNSQRPNNNNNNNRRNNNNNNNNNNRRHENFRPVKTEVDEDLIQKQIKETYARMTEGKGKAKGAKYRREKRENFSQKLQEENELKEMTSNVLKVTEFVTVNELAIMMDNTPVTKVIEACMNLGLMVSINQRLDAEALVLVAEEFGYEIEFVTADIKEAIQEEVDTEEDLVARPPIITVMGHVDHGKTSLLDYIRKANVIAGEAGGITQHIGAYNVKMPSGRKITFLDTPGHEAFTAMRARGAKVTDLAIIIVAADDAIMPQTIEAINHAQAAGVPMIFAINKIDKPAAHPDKIREQLSGMNILVEDWGGKYQCQEIAAKSGLNVDKLLEKVLLEADMLDLKANPNKRAVGSVIESSLDKGRGFVATLLVQGGTLRVGDVMLCGSYTGKVKAMFNERGQKIEEAGPSTPVSILGLNGAPTAGDLFNIMEGEKEARDLANKREQLLRIQGLRTQKHITLEEIGRRIAVGNFQELNIIIKGDVDGSIEALSDSLIKLSNEEIHVNVIHKAVGAISESDVLLAAASNAIIIGFQVRPSANARKIADSEEIDIRLYSVIYDAINEVKSGIEGMLAPEEKEEISATAEVRETFKISKVGTIAGCMVKDGKLSRNAKVRLIRDGIVQYTGELGSLKRFKDDVKEVQSGYDCGLNIEGYNDIRVGDIIEAYTIVQIKRKL